MAAKEPVSAGNGTVEGVIKSDLEALRSDLSALIRDVAGMREQITTDAKSKIDKTITKVSGLVKSEAEELSELARDQVDTARDTVKRNPLASVAIAFGVGLVLAHLTRR